MTANSSSRSIGLRIAPCTFKRACLFFHAAVGAEQHDRQVRERRVVLLRDPKLGAAHPRHHQIEQDETRARAALQDLQRLLPVGGGFDLVPPITQGLHQRLADVEVVLDEQDGEWGHDRIVLEQPYVIRFCCSNRLEALVEALADTVGAGRASLFDPVTPGGPQHARRRLRQAGVGATLGYRRATSRPDFCVASCARWRRPARPTR